MAYTYRLRGAGQKNCFTFVTTTYTLNVLDVNYRINIHTRVMLFQCECNRPIDQKFCHTRFCDLFPPVDIPSLCYIIVLIQTNDFHLLMSYILVPCVSVASGLYRTSYMLSLSISFSIMLRLFHNRNLLFVFFLQELFWYSIVCPCLTAYLFIFSIILYILVGGNTLHIPLTLFFGPFNN